MRVLVTGAKGQLGSELRVIASADYLFTDIEELDICSEEAVAEFVERNKIDMIVNCAAYTNVDRAEEECDVAERVNSSAVATLARVAKRNNARLIHISTDYVFGGEMFNAPIEEYVTTAPLGVYGRTKLLGERAIKESGCDYVIIRTSWLYSTYGKNFVKTIMRLASERDELRVVNDQIGSPTYAKDLAMVIVQICERRAFECGVYHYANRGEISWYDFARAIVEMCGAECRVVPCTTKEYGAKALRPAYSVLCTEKIRSSLGCEIPDWRVSLERCMKMML
ncbi:MAG: dTDP-4-dehydrorhamnose reductase [Alistipes sp.]|nr:dTDP-4-dehydrorhamnose reductase [Alistipes sp.]